MGPKFHGRETVKAETPSFPLRGVAFNARSVSATEARNSLCPNSIVIGPVRTATKGVPSSERIQLATLLSALRCASERRVSRYKVAPLPLRSAKAKWRPANATLSISPPWNSKKASESQNQWGFGCPPKLQGQETEQEQASKILPKILSEAGACAASVPVEGVSPCPATMEPAAAAAQRYDKIERVIETRVGAFGLNESVDRRHPAQRTTLTSDLTQSRTGSSQRALQPCRVGAFCDKITVWRELLPAGLGPPPLPHYRATWQQSRTAA